MSKSDSTNLILSNLGKYQAVAYAKVEL